MAWGPVVDYYTRWKEHQFMPDFPENLLRDGNVQFHPHFSYMSGVTRDEGSAFLCKFIIKNENQVFLNFLF